VSKQPAGDFLLDGDSMRKIKRGLKDPNRIGHPVTE